MSDDLADDRPQQLLAHPKQLLDRRQRRWLRPLDGVSRFVQAALYHVNRWVMQLLFGLHVDGTDHLPDAGRYVLAPNHTSSLDPCLIAASISLQQLRRLRWAARQEVCKGGPIRQFIFRIAGVIPIRRSMESLAAGSAILDRDEILVWFPEGTRSRSGELQDFKTGIGYLLQHHRAAVIPVAIRGAHSVMPPPRRRLRRLAKICVTIGEPLTFADGSPEEIVQQLRQALLSMLSDDGGDELRPSTCQQSP